MTDHRPRDLRLVGAMASLVALGVLYAAAILMPDAPFAPSAVAERIIRATPGGVATFFIEALGHWARRLLELGGIALAAVAGAEALRRLRSPLWAAAVLVVVAGAASFASPSQEASGPRVALAVVLAGGAYVAIAGAMLRTLATEEVDAGRRRVLRMGAGAALGIAAGGWVAGLVARSFGGPDTDVDLVAPTTPATTPEATDWPDITGLSPEITTAADHYVVDINLVQPSVEADGWNLRVLGEVERPTEYDFMSLQRSFNVVQEYSVLCCVSNEVGGDLIGNSAWGGVRLKDVLEAAGVKEGALDVVFRAADGYSDSVPLEVAMQPSVLLAVSQNGAPLTQEHGFPCRVRIPSIYGMKNVKWVESIELTPRDYQGYWQERGWSDVATVRTQSRIDVAGEDFSARSGEDAWIAGISWAGDRGISKVEVSTDGGETWNDARLKEPIAEAAWTLWAYRWTPEDRGAVEVVCRATDDEGRVQTDEEEPPHPAGATGYHRVTVQVS
jgi:DMSO/TMAO reductase YedYZ molybdopterin-dependent catalytic subunit